MNATFRTRPRFLARGQPGAGFLEARRGLVPDAVRRHARAVHRYRRGARAAVPAQYRPRLGYGRVRHVAALDPYPHRPRGGARPAERAHAGDPAADRPQPARRHRPRRARRAPDPHRLRRLAGRWRHPHGGDHRQLCRPLSGAGEIRHGRAAGCRAVRPTASRQSRAACARRSRSSTSTTPRTPRR